jgi:hypothetical protein
LGHHHIRVRLITASTKMVERRAIPHGWRDDPVVPRIASSRDTGGHRGTVCMIAAVVNSYGQCVCAWLARCAHQEPAPPTGTASPSTASTRMT